jgi:hypothetical protein
MPLKDVSMSRFSDLRNSSPNPATLPLNGFAAGGPLKRYDAGQRRWHGSGDADRTPPEPLQSVTKEVVGFHVRLTH